jgi:hypothetical protein
MPCSSANLLASCSRSTLDTQYPCNQSRSNRRMYTALANYL